MKSGNVRLARSCLICGRRLSWLRWKLGIMLCRRRSCKREAAAIF